MFQSAVQAAFNDHQTGESGDNDFGFGIDMNDLDVNNDNNDDELALGDLNDIFDSDPFGTGGAATSPTGSPRGAGQMSQPGSPGSAIPGSEAFRSVQYTCTVWRELHVCTWRSINYNNSQLNCIPLNALGR